MIHTPYKANQSFHNFSRKLRGVFRSVYGCWDMFNGTKMDSVACGPTPAPTPSPPIPTKTPTSSPTPHPTIRSHWAVKMTCEDAHATKLDPKNCAQIRNGHAIVTKHHKSR